MSAQSLVLLLLFCSCPATHSIVTLRPKNERGPSAWNSGVECLLQVHSIFQSLKIVLEDSEAEGNATVVPRVKNVIMLHLHNLTTPSAEIESNYLKLLNQLISSGQMQSKLRVVSDNYRIDRLANVPFNMISTAEFYILVTDDFEKLIESMRRTVTRTSSWNPAAKFIILFNNVQHRSSVGRWDVNKAFQEFATQFHVNHICLLFATSGWKYNIYLSRLFQRSKNDSKCVPMSAEKVTECENGKIEGVDHFSRLLQKAAVPKDLSHCTFTACASTAQPFVTASCRSGLEIELLKFIANYLNFNLSIFCTKMPRGDIDEKGQLSNLLLKLREDECDLIIGSMYPDNDIHWHFKTSLAYYEDSYAWFVPLAPKRAPWKGLALIFQQYTWLFIAFILVFSSLFWHIISIVSGDRRKFNRYSMCLLNNWSTLLCISVPLQPLKSSLRILFMAITLYSLNITTIYTSQLISVFTEPAYDAQLATIEEVLRLGLAIGGREEYLDWFRTGYPVDDWILSRYNISEEFTPNEKNLRRIQRGHQAILLSRLYVTSRNTSKLIYGLPENVFSNQVEMIFEKGFPLVSLFDKIINRVKDNGIIYKFYDDWRYRMSKHDIVVDEDAEIILTVKHLEAAFAVLGYGLLLSIFVFLCEVFFHRTLQIRVWRIKLIRGYYLTVKYPMKKGKRVV